MKILRRLVIAVLSCGPLFFGCDIWSNSKRGTPIFMVAVRGREVIDYFGLGYRITKYYPLTNDFGGNPSDEIESRPFIMIMGACLFFCSDREGRKQIIKPNRIAVTTNKIVKGGQILSAVYAAFSIPVTGRSGSSLGCAAPYPFY